MKPKTLRNGLLAVMILWVILLMTITALAQDETPAATDEPAITQEATANATEEADATEQATSELASATPLPTLTALPTGTPLPTLTDLPTLTPVPDFTATPVPPPVEPPPPVDNGGSAFAIVGWVLALLSISALVFVLVTWVRELRKSAAAGDQNSKNLLGFVTAAQNMLPVDQFLMLIDGLNKRAKATPTPGEVDDRAMEQIRAMIYEILNRELPPEVPVAPDAPNVSDTPAG